MDRVTVLLFALFLPTVHAGWEIGDPATESSAAWFASYAEGGTETLIPSHESSLSGFQPTMSLPSDATTARTACPHLPSGTTTLLDWNDASTDWPGRDAAGPPLADGAAITLPAGVAMIIRAGHLVGTASSPYGRITVPSTSSLIFDDTGVGGATIALQTLGIRIDGALEAGSPTCRLEGNVEITLHGEYGSTAASDRPSLLAAAKDDLNVKGIVVTGAPGSRMELHGKLYHPTWTRLAAHVPGQTQQETGAPTSRNTVVFLQDCVNWPAGGQVLVTTSRVKDTRDYTFNEEVTIAAGDDSVQCITVDGGAYGQVTLATPLEHYHHAGKREYQSEVALLSRNIKVQGNDKSEPTDASPLACAVEGSSNDVNKWAWSTMPCPDTFLTGFGGHTIIVGEGEGRLRGVEFWRMGMTNVVGRYPVHWHHSTTGEVSEVADCSVHHSFYRAVTVHDTFKLRVSRNTAYDVTGHAFYLESGVEEFNRVEYNLAAFVHAINGAQVMPTATTTTTEQSDKIAVPADHTASGFYISNVHNYVVGNAASGGWAGIQFPVLPEPVDPSLRFNGVVPKDRTSLLISGNSVHSSSWFSYNSGAIYAGGTLYWEEDDLDSTTLKYNAGRTNGARRTRQTVDLETGEVAWFKVQNTTAWLVNVGATGWGRRSEYLGFEVHDFQNRGIFVLFDVWLDNLVLNCRSSNARRVPDAGTKGYEKLLNDGRKWSGFQTYDHLMRHILTNWKISNCGGVARGFAPWVEGGQVDDSDLALFTIPANGFGPEVQLVSSGTEYDWDTMGGKQFLNESIFFAGSGGENYHSMQYMSNWEDHDGSMTDRGVSTVLGPARAGKWWELDYRPGKCELRDQWKLHQYTCDKGDRHLGSMFTVVMPQKNTQGSLVLGMIDPTAGSSQTTVRSTRQGSMTHFGLDGDGHVDACHPPATCGETTSRSWDPDLTGPYNHARYGGWYLSWDYGTPAYLTMQRVQMDHGSVMVQAMSVPPGTIAANIRVWAESYYRELDYSLVSSVKELRASQNGGVYFLDVEADTLYWRVVPGYVTSGSTNNTFDWIDLEANGLYTFERAGLAIRPTTTKNQFQLHIKLDCATDAATADAFCVTKPAFNVPAMGCDQGEVMVAIDQCGKPCQLDNSCPPDCSNVCNGAQLRKRGLRTVYSAP